MGIIDPEAAMSDDNITDIEDARKQRGRPRKAEAEKSDFKGPKSVSFLASITGQHRRTIERKLMTVKPVERQGKSDLYDLSEALEAIYKTESGLSTKVLSKLRPGQLPPNTEAAFWGAQEARIELYRTAGHLWETDHIELALDAIIKTVRDTVLSLPERIKAGERAGKTHQDVAYGILEAIEKQASKSISELRGHSYSAELLLIEEQMSTQQDYEDGVLPDED